MTQEQQPIDLMAAVARVQRAVVVPKAKYNAFGKFSYRSYEDIVAALKEPCAKEGLAFFMTDELVQIGDRYYVKSTACVFPAEGGEGLLQVSAYAREDEHKKGSDDAQVTGHGVELRPQVRAVRCVRHRRAERSRRHGGAARARGEAAAADGPFTAHCRSCGARYQFASMPQYMEFVANSPCCPRPTGRWSRCRRSPRSWTS